MVDLMSLALGVVAVLIVLGVVIMFYAVNQVFLLKKKFDYLEKEIRDSYDFLNRRIDESTRSTEQMVMQSHNHTDEVEKQLISMIDSRLDKLENKIIQKQVL
jgi:hypothetical protein